MTIENQYGGNSKATPARIIPDVRLSTIDVSAVEQYRVRQRADPAPIADTEYSDRMVVTQERRPHADVIEEVLDRICVMREELLRIQRKLERIKSDDREEETSKRQSRTTMTADGVWQELYKAAVLETNDEELHKRIRTAKAAIDARLHQLQSDDGGTPDERRAISDALAVLNGLRREREARSHDTGSSNV